MLRYTEQQNPLSASLDGAGGGGFDAERAVRILRQVDAQIRSGCDGCPGMTDPQHVHALGMAAAMVQEVVEKWSRGEQAFVVFSGSGTSGRLAYAVARSLNAVVNCPRGACSGPFGFLIAGGPQAILAAHENAEDIAAAGAMDLREFARRWSATHLLVVGVSCGMSATYVGSQLQLVLDPARAGLDDVEMRCIVMGFNPLDIVPKTTVPGWSTTFWEVATKAGSLMTGDASPGHTSSVATPLPVACLLNPVVGPEAVAGSTRMKGGSATKMLLETMGLHGIAASRAGPVWLGARLLKQTLLQLDGAVSAAYSDPSTLAHLATVAGECLVGGGRIMYVGRGSVGLLGVIDASECPPTFGASFDDVRALWAAKDAVFKGDDSSAALSQPSSPASVSVSSQPPTAHVPAALAAGAARLAAASGGASDDATAASESVGSEADEHSWSDPTSLSRVRGDEAEAASGSAAAAASTGEGVPSAGPGTTMRRVGTGDVLVVVCSDTWPVNAEVVDAVAAAKSAGASIGAIACVSGDAETGGGLELLAPHLNAPLVVVPVTSISVRAAALHPPAGDGKAGFGALSGFCPGSELSLKLCLNAVSTVAHVRKGCVLGNRMINLRVTNRKLFVRAATLVQSLTGTSTVEAEAALLAAIYGTHDLSHDLLTADHSVHVSNAASKDLVVPAAVLMAATTSTSAEKLTPEEALTMLGASGSVAACIAELSQ